MVSIPELYDASGKVAIVTGSGNGIGFSIARRLAEAGASVVVNATSEESVDGAIERMHGPGMRLAGAVADVSQPADVERMLCIALEAFGRVDVLVNNAGIFSRGPNFPEMSVEHWDRVMAINSRGVFICSEVVSKQMIAQNQGGNIVNISSTAGLKTVDNSGIAYGTSKAGIQHFTRICAKLLSKHRIRVNTVVPGSIETERMLAKGATLRTADTIPLGRRGQPDDIARAVLFLVSDMAAYITGVTLPVDGGSSLV